MYIYNFQIHFTLPSSLLILPNILFKSKKVEIEVVKKQDIITILGNDSEIDLLKHIKNSYVVSNAKEIKKLATNKTKSNNAKGSENIIKKI